jgi:FixJ family two-component response regulator
LCLIVDQHMPGMTGLELAEQLRAEGNIVPIILITGWPSRTVYVRAAELGVEQALEKPPANLAIGNSSTRPPVTAEGLRSGAIRLHPG